MRSRVPYISKAEAERRRWVDLADAIGHVKAVDDCDDRQALQSIKTVIEDEKINWRWEDQAQPPRFSVGPIGWAPPVSDMLPAKWRLDAKMRLKDTTGRFRVLLLLKSALYALFKQQPRPELEKPENTFRRAPDAAIEQAIEKVYKEAEAANNKPPNIKELPIPVLQLLKNQGYETSKSRIMKAGEKPDFQRRRRLPGKTLKNEQRSHGKNSH